MPKKVSAKIRETLWTAVFGATWARSLDLFVKERAVAAKYQADLAVKFAEEPEYMSEPSPNRVDL